MSMTKYGAVPAETSKTASGAPGVKTVSKPQEATTVRIAKPVAPPAKKD